MILNVYFNLKGFLHVTEECWISSHYLLMSKAKQENLAGGPLQTFIYKIKECTNRNQKNYKNYSVQGTRGWLAKGLNTCPQGSKL